LRKILILQISSWNQWRFLHAGLGEVSFCNISTSGSMSMTWKFRSLDSFLSKAGLWNLGLTNLELLSCFEIHGWRNLKKPDLLWWGFGKFWKLSRMRFMGFGNFKKMSRMRFIAFCLWTKCQTGLLLLL
jgi:hypothetical protein